MLALENDLFLLIDDLSRALFPMAKSSSERIFSTSTQTVADYILYAPRLVSRLMAELVGGKLFRTLFIINSPKKKKLAERRAASEIAKVIECFAAIYPN